MFGMNQNNSTWTVLFLGSTNPIIGLKMNSNNKKTIVRGHYDFIADRAIWIHYYYYFENFQEPMCHRDVEVSVFISRLSKLMGTNYTFIFIRNSENEQCDQIDV